jgi:hypothetical protein
MPRNVRATILQRSEHLCELHILELERVPEPFRDQRPELDRQAVPTVVPSDGEGGNVSGGNDERLRWDLERFRGPSCMRAKDGQRQD